MQAGVGLETLKIRLNSLQKELPPGTRLVAVSKNRPLEDIQNAYMAGQRDFGENRVQELLEKAQALENTPDICWHFIGHLQTNKIRMLFKVPHLLFIHSVDSLKLLQALLKEETLLTHEVNFFLQIHTSGEEEKNGFREKDELAQALEFLKSRSEGKLKLKGLMTMGPIRTEDFQEGARDSFAQLAQLKRELEQNYSLPPLLLSMGMSQDYKLALEHGSHFVRIGSAIFAP